MKGNMIEAIEKFVDEDAFNEIDIHFAALMKKLSGDACSDGLVLAAALLSNFTTGKKNTCFDLRAWSGRKLSDFFSDARQDLKKKLSAVEFPGDAAEWEREILMSPVSGKADSQSLVKTPLVIDVASRLYLHRYWDYERRLAEAICGFAGSKAARTPRKWRKMLDGYFEEQKTKNPKWQVDEWQKLAVLVCLGNRFSVVSGGPGTGKTTIVAAVISILLEESMEAGQGIEIAVCAPTGKAAVRIQESLRRNLSGKAAGTAGLEAKTIHRLLGYIPDSPFFRHNADNPLTADIVVVDEASMVSLPLMSKLFNAIKPQASVIMLGDRDQLASVESGAVFADICRAANINRFSESFAGEYAEFAGVEMELPRTASRKILTDSAVGLRKSFRFPDDRGIAKVSGFVRQGRADEVFEELEKGWKDIVFPGLPEKKNLKERLKAAISGTSYWNFHAEDTVEKAYEKFCSFRILCSNRKGVYGVETINRIVIDLLMEKDDGRIPEGAKFFRGRPIIITENDYVLRLFNGDTGIIWSSGNGAEDDEGGELRAYFPPMEAGKPFISFPVSRLPAYETAYAMTVHKAQGSGFGNVLLILSDKYSPTMKRELVYTGITRTEKAVEIWAGRDVFSRAIVEETSRNSGLMDALSR